MLLEEVGGQEEEQGLGQLLLLDSMEERLRLNQFKQQQPVEEESDGENLTQY